MPTLPPSLRLEIRAHPTHTHLVLRDAGQTLLTAWLPPTPAHRQALPRVSEGLALWWNRPLHVVLAVADPAAWWCGAPRWDGIGAVSGDPQGPRHAFVYPAPLSRDTSRGGRPRRRRALTP
jgi:hypothetical protein